LVRLKLLNEYIILVYIRGKNLRKKRKRKKKEDIGPIEYFDYMQGIKDPLKNIIRNYSNKEFQTIIDDLINRTNKIVCRSYQFLKLYVLHSADLIMIKNFLK
jgi:hypothetical protein